MLLAAVFDAMENHKQADLLMDEAAQAIKAANADYLYANLRAVVTRRKIDKGDKAIAAEWLLYFAYDLDDEYDEQLTFYRFARHFTTLRALLLMERWPEAVTFGERLRRLAESYARPLDTLETYLLLAIAQMRNGNGETAREILYKALALAYRYNYRQMFINEGQRLARALQQIIANDAVAAELRTFAASLNIPWDAIEEEAPAPAPIRLSRQQTLMLKQLAIRGTYGDIAKRTGLQKSSVKTHLVRLYKALGVKNRTEALAKARLLGVIE